MTRQRDPLVSDGPPNAYSWFMITLSVMFLLGYTVLVLRPDLPGSVLAAISLSMAVIWVFFVIDYVASFVRSGLKWRFVSRHWLLTLSLFLPVTRPFILLLYINRLKYFKRKTGTSVRLKIGIIAASFAALFIYMISLTVLRFERGEPGSNIESFGDAIWWAFVTIATVGYGDFYPVTVPGRFFAIILMVGGVAIVGTASALVVSYLAEQTQKVVRQHEPSTSSQRDATE